MSLLETLSLGGGGRVIGGAFPPIATIDAHPPLGPAGTLTVGVIDTGVVLDGRGRPPDWFGVGHLSYCAEEDVDEIVYPQGRRLGPEGHGTFVAGVVLREAPTARVRMWGVLAKERVPLTVEEVTPRDDQAVAVALAALALNPQVQVVNLSFGGSVVEMIGDLGDLGKALGRFLEDRPDVAVVAAAGNHHTTRPCYPAAFPGVLGVGAVDETSPVPGETPRRAHFSNHGDWVGAYASGKDVLGPLPLVGATGWARWSGTSFASAVVAGRIAQVAIERRLTGSAAKDAVLDESTTLPDGTRWVRGFDSPPAP